MKQNWWKFWTIPVIVVMNVCSGFQTLRSGIYDNPACSNTTFSHAVVLIGYGVENGMPYGSSETRKPSS